tara:strand:- start:412 stop:912 length:501 start_codon:yes stop_codon:yes gene_type:complete
MEKKSFSELFKGSNEGVIITNTTYNIEYYNPVVNKLIPNLSSNPIKKDFEVVINFDCELNQDISYDLFELDHFLLITKNKFSFNGKDFFIFRITISKKDTIEHRLSFFLDNIDEIVYTEKKNDSHGVRTGYVSKGIEKITGMSSKEMISQNMLPHQFSFKSDQKKS